jgi:nicotinamide mononucleotide (NMN) deamidase PncC
MSKFTDHLWSDLVQEHGPTLAQADRPQPGRSRRPRLLAGSTLALAGVGAALILALSGSAAPPAFAITKQNDGSVLVHLNYVKNLNLAQVEQKLKDMGTNEEITIYMATGAATVNGPATCAPATGAASPSGPQVKVLVGSNGTEVIGAGQSGGNTAEGSFHLNHCVTSDAGSANAGNTGVG